MTITPQNGPYNSEITLSVREPAISRRRPAARSIRRRSPPDASAARSRLTIATTARTATATARGNAPRPTHRRRSLSRPLDPVWRCSDLAALRHPDGRDDDGAAVRVSSRISAPARSAIAGISVTGDFTGVNNCGSTLAIGAHRAPSPSASRRPRSRVPAPARSRSSTTRRGVSHREPIGHRPGGAGRDRRHRRRHLHRRRQRRRRDTLSAFHRRDSDGAMTIDGYDQLNEAGLVRS